MLRRPNTMPLREDGGAQSEGSDKGENDSKRKSQS